MSQVLALTSGTAVVTRRNTAVRQTRRTAVVAK
jgi:hypothetical protein